MAGESKVVTLRTARYWKDAEGILHGEAVVNAEHGLEDCKEQLTLQRTMIEDGHPLPFLMDIRHARKVTREARVFYAGSEAAEVLAATALLIGSPISRAIANFFLGMNKPKMPTRLFTSESEALEWLRQYR